MTISIIDPHSPQYQQVWELREAVLRKPLGRSLKNEDLSRDLTDTIFGAEEQDTVVGCVILHHTPEGHAQLRAMAVYDHLQGKGVGAALVKAFEQHAKEKGYSKIILHARAYALGFYQKLGYTAYGDEFTEVGIPHYMMEKEL